MYEADACKCRRRLFPLSKNYRQMCLMDYFKRLETYLEMKTERFTAVKRSVFLYEYHRICVRRSFMRPLLGNPNEIVPRQPEIIRTAGTSR